jgi:hypothetical protein
MNNWNSPLSLTPANYQRVLVCRADKFVIIGQYVSGNYHDTRYSRELTKSVITGNFFWMPLPSIDSIKELLDRS